MLARLLLAVQLALALAAGCNPAYAQDLTHLDVSGLPDGEYPANLTVKGGKLIAARPLSVKVVKFGQTNPDDPQPPQPLSPLALAVSKLSQTAITTGAMPNTAARLTAVYALVSAGCSDGSIPLAHSSALLVSAIDAVLKDAPDKNAWSGWRTGVNAELAKVSGLGSDKAVTVKALQDIATGIEHGFSGAGLLDNIDWEAIKAFIVPLLKDLLIKLLLDALKPK